MKKVIYCAIVSKAARGGRQKKLQIGFTIIELLVGSILAAIMIAAVSAFIAQGSNLSRKDILRRGAFQLMSSVLEDTSFCGGKIGAQFDTLWNKAPDSFVINPPQIIYGQTVCSLSVIWQQRVDTIYSTAIHGIYVKARAVWFDGQPQEDSLCKIITYVRG